jgi:hypothetical protein
MCQSGALYIAKSKASLLALLVHTGLAPRLQTQLLILP